MKRITLSFLFCIIFYSSTAYTIDFGKLVGQTIVGAQQIAEASKEITPSEEYYIGRAVCAMALQKYRLLNNVALDNYVNKVGLLVAYHSDRPVTYGGYHFAVLANDEPNAFACPGGMILINKGLLRQIQNEDQLAMVLGHEIAHVAHQHGIRAIKKSRWTKFGFYAAESAGSHYTSSQAGQLVGAFQGVVSDVGKKVLESGYSQGDEKDADMSGMRFAAKAGYNPKEMIVFIEHEKNAGIGHAHGPFSSHPTPDTRIKRLVRESDGIAPGARTAKVRTNRYRARRPR
jgi:predicted Zn-dependent protease